MKTRYVLSSVVALAGLVIGSAQAQQSNSANGPDKSGSPSMLGSEKKAAPASAPDASKPESKLGSNTKAKSKPPVGADGASPGPYGVGLKKARRPKNAQPDTTQDSTPK